jgi:hypothetical protein
MNLNFLRTPLATLVLGTAASLLAPAPASAALVSGTATITIDNSAFAASSVNAGGGYPNGWIVNTFWDSSYNTTGISGSAAPGAVLSTTGSTAMSFPVNSNTTTISYPSAGTYGRTVQATTMDASNTSSGQIGLSGGWLLTSPGGSGILTPYDFSLTKTGSTWNIRTFDNAFGSQNFLTLANVVESLNGNGELLLTGDLKWTGLWASLVGANTSAVVGSFSLAPTAVPVPAAVWLFGSALAGLLGLGRKKAGLAA